MSYGSLKVYTRQAKTRFLFVLAFLAIVVLARAPAACAQGYDVPDPQYDAPAGYYNSATGTQTTLRTNLHNIISSGFTSTSYGDSRSILPVLWQDPNNSSNMIEVYTYSSIPKPDGSIGGIPGWDGGATWNREHLFPQSILGVSVSNTYKGPASDLFELAPSNPSVNGSRGNNDYGAVGETGNTYANHGSYWFPGDQDKGDIARSMFYMATRYFDGSSTPSINNLSIVNGYPNDPTVDKYHIGDLQALLQWNYEDGVNNFERRKNNLIYTTYQHNRNPFIDHPEYVWAVFGDSANNSQISVATPNSNGASSTTASLGNVIVGSSFGTSNVTVSKTGHTPTTFNITTAGNAITTGTGLLAGTGHPFDYDTQSQSMTVGLNASTGTAGAKTGTVTIHNSDISTSAGTGQGSADGDDVVTVTGNVYDHANGSFSSSSDVNSQTVNLGIYSTGTGTHSAGFNISNLINTSGFTASLAYLSNSGTGSTSALTTNIASAFTSNLAAGSTLGLNASLNSASAGNYSATYTLNLSDDTSITGHTAQAITLTLTGEARGAESIYWTASSSNNWDLSNTITNWTDTTKNEVYLQGDTVNFDDSHSTNHAVTLNTAVTPAAVVINHSTGADYTISGSGSIGGSSTLSKTGSGKVTLSTNNTYSGGTTVSGGTLVVGHYHALGNGGLAITNSATTQIASGMGTVVLPSLNINGGSSTPTATLDIGANSVVIPYSGTSPFSTIQAQIQYATHNLAFDRPGITSSAADGFTTAVGYAEASELFIDGGGTYVNNQSPNQSGTNTVIAGEAVILKYTWLGDTDLNGEVDQTDFNNELNFLGTTSGADWNMGDNDGNGTVDQADFNNLLSNLGASGLAGGSAPGPVPVPEPSTLLLAALGLAGVAAFARRRRGIKIHG